MSSHSAAACALHFSTLVLLLLLAGTADSASNNGDDVSGNVTTATITSGAGNSSSPSGMMPAVVKDHVEMYTCYLCSGRNPLMIHWCPIYWDECHLNCEETDAAASAAPTVDVAAVRDASSRSGPVSPAPAVLPGDQMLDINDPGDDDECYVMKLYNNGSYVIVVDLKCGQVKSCVLTCGGGEVLGGTTRNAQPAISAAPMPVGVAFQDYRPRLADFQRCGGDTVVRRRGHRSDRKG